MHITIFDTKMSISLLSFIFQAYLVQAQQYSTFTNQHIESKDYYEDVYSTWALRHDVKSLNEAHYQHLLENFATNHDYIANSNSKKLPYILGHNKFSHMNRLEWKSFVGNIYSISKAAQSREANLRANRVLSMKGPTHEGELPNEVDWTKTRGIVTAIKQQGLCGSCYAFAAVAGIEAAYNIKHNFDGQSGVAFSEQQFIDCDPLGGCSGGTIAGAYEWAHTNGFLCIEDAYPYISGTTHGEGECNQDKCVHRKEHVVKGLVELEPNSDERLMEAVYKQPVTVTVDSWSTEFQFFKDGVLTSDCGHDLSHGILVVGYGTSNDGIDYYKAKNGWGVEWGNKGFIKLQRGGDVEPEGKCGILMQPNFPVV